MHALTDFPRSNKIEVLNVVGPRESKGARRLIHRNRQWLDTTLDLVGGEGECGNGNLNLVVSGYFRLKRVG